MSKKHTKMNLDFDIKFSDIDDSDHDSGFAKANVLICYTGKNRNKTIISEDVLTNACKTLKNIPIVGHYDGDENEFGGHDLGVKKDDKNNIVLYNETTPFGVIPESAKIWYEDEVVDGETKKCLFANAILWKRQYGYEHIKEAGSLSQSMEIDVYDYERTDDGYVNIKDFVFTALCILERDEPCFENASVSLYSKHDDITENFKRQFSTMLDEFMLEMSREGEKVNKNTKDNKKAQFSGNTEPEQTQVTEPQTTEPENEPTTEPENKPVEPEQGNTAEPENEPTEPEQGNGNVDDEKFSIIKERYMLDSDKKKKFSEALISGVINDEATGKETGYLDKYLMDYDEKYVYFEERFYSYVEGLNDYSCKKRASYKANEDKVEIGDAEEVFARYLTKDEINLIEANAKAEALKALDAYKEKYPSDKFAELEQYKIDNEKRIKSEKEDEILAKYSESLKGSSEFDELVKNKANYSLEDLDKECLVLVGKFALINQHEENTDNAEKNFKFSVSDGNTNEDARNYGGILKHF